LPKSAGDLGVDDGLIARSAARVRSSKRMKAIR
jgi:hypothetical protein